MDNFKNSLTDLLLQDFLNFIPGNVFWKDINGVYLGCNIALARLLGFQSTEEIVGKTDYDILPYELAYNISQIDKNIINNGEECILEEIGLNKKQGKAIYLTKKAPIISDKKVIGIIGISIDITKNKKAIEELLKTQEQSILTLNDIVASMPGNVYWMDKNGTMLGCNDNQLHTLGLHSKEDFIGKNYMEILNDDSTQFVNDINEKVFNTGEKVSIEEIGLNSKGEEAIYLTEKTPLFDINKKVIGMLGVSLDITDQKRADEYRKKCEAEVAKKMINFSNLVAGSIAHELKNPLAGIRMQMEILRTLDLEKIQPKEASSIIDDVTSAIIKTVDDTSYFINGMLKKVRTFATGEAHHKEFEELSITADIEDLLATYPFKKNEQDLIKTAFDIRFKYLGDKVLTGHVLSNLMKNALHAIAQTDKEDATITIETKTDPGGEFNLLIFRDTATGIPADFVEKIFDQFETKKDVHGGTGLGLAFCKAVMKDNYGGDITCTSKEEEFTEFVLKFPKIKPKK